MGIILPWKGSCQLNLGYYYFRTVFVSPLVTTRKKKTDESKTSNTKQNKTEMKK